MFDSKNVIPLYQQLMNRLKEDISSGVYEIGDQLPPEIEMAKLNNVSVVTARKAVNELSALGLVEKKQGKGTFVARPKYGRDFTHITSFSESCNMIGVKAGSLLLKRHLIVPSDDILKSLNCQPGSNAVYISRLRYVNDEPVVIESNYFSLNYAFLLDEPIENSLFDLIRERSKTNITKSNKRINICRSSSSESKLLNIKRNYPLLFVQSIAFSENDEPVYVGTQKINADKFELMI